MVSQVSYKAINLVSADGSITITDLANGDTNLETSGGGGSGTVTSVGLSAPSIFTVSNSPVTTSGTLALTYSGTALPIANGGTAETTATGAFNRLSGYTVNSSASVSLSAASTYNQFFIGGSSSATLPDVTTLTLGYTFHIVNQTSSTLLVDADGTTIFLIPINTGALFTCIRITAPQETAWVYATSDLWSTGDGSSAGNTGITGIGRAVLQIGASITSPTITNAPSVSVQNAGATGGLTLVRNTDVASNSTRMYLDSSSGVGAIYNGAGSLFFNTNATVGVGTGVNQFRVAPTASAVNYVQVTGAATAQQPTLSAQGSDTNVGLILTTKGVSSLQFRTNNTSNVQAFVAHTGSSVNYVQMTGSVTGASPSYAVAGSDTNVDLALTPKGTGKVRFGTYTGTVLTPTGYVEIKDSGGTIRRLLVG
jgi:hypothetical protein